MPLRSKVAMANAHHSGLASANCAACGATVSPAHEAFYVGSYKVIRCGRCHSLTTAPLPSDAELSAYYADYSGRYTAGMGAQRYQTEMPKRWRARLRKIASYQPSGRLLDLGGGNAMFGRLAHEHGFRVDIADYVPAPVDVGFCTVQPANISDVGGTPFADQSFDVVTMWSSIEHVKTPETAVQEAFRLLRPGGYLALDTPLVGDFCELNFAARTNWVCPPEHLHLFSSQGLVRALERAGFRVRYVAPFFERTPLRWLARRGRNVALGLLGGAMRLSLPETWSRRRRSQLTTAGDIQFVIAQRP